MKNEACSNVQSTLVKRGRVAPTKQTNHDQFLTYLKGTCSDKKSMLYQQRPLQSSRKPVESSMHQQLIVTMRTQYEARPNS